MPSWPPWMKVAWLRVVQDRLQMKATVMLKTMRLATTQGSGYLLLFKSVAFLPMTKRLEIHESRKERSIW